MRRACLLVVVLAGCAGNDSPPPPERSDNGLTVNVYFLRDGKIAVARRDVRNTQQVATAALGELVAGPEADERMLGMRSAVPATWGFTLSVDEGLAAVESPGRLSRGAAAQVVHTVTQFETIRKVRIGGSTYTRADFESLAPPILVEYPTPGDSITSPLLVQGTSNTFEATMFVRVVDASGRELVDQLVTATSGSGTRGTFDATLRFTVEREGPGMLVAYERSAEDGSEIHVVRIPVELRR